MKYIKNIRDITLNDVALVGGKTASLGEMMHALSSKKFKVPQGFAITSQGYWHFVQANKLEKKIEAIMHTLSRTAPEREVKIVGKKIRTLFLRARLPQDLEDEIMQAYAQLSKVYGKYALSVAVRSSATAEDLPGASFAGQQESYLHIQGASALLQACKDCFASLFTDRAIVYRLEKGFDYRKIALTIAVQKMVRSDKACSGVAFSLDTETGFNNVVIINASYGLGESIVQGIVTPDEYTLFKPALKNGFDALISKKVGSKKEKLVYGTQRTKATVWKKVPQKQQTIFCLSDTEIIELGKLVLEIEEHYSARNKKWTPMDVEWAKDGDDGTLYIVQARPETVHSQENNGGLLTDYVLANKNPKIILEGQSIGQKIVSGPVKIISSIKHASLFKRGDILVAEQTDPDWVPLLKIASGVITDSGGRTCHAAIVSRELGIPAIVGTGDGTKTLKNNEQVTLDCSKGSKGYVYEGKQNFTIKKINKTKLAQPPVELMVNIGDPEQAFAVAQLPSLSGVGLARLEFIIASTIKVHPLACLGHKIPDKRVQKQLDALAAAFKSKKDFFVEQLSYGIATIAAAFYPKPVIVRFSDFKSNEYRNLLGGSFFEPHEENPMLGLRGASRYYSDLYKNAFALECKAMKKVYFDKGLNNIIMMIPFVRTVQEAERVLKLLADNGLKRRNGLKVYMMVEVPSNVILFDEFCTLFDGFSIGSNDLTQFVLAVDRDSALVAPLFDERNEAVKKMMAWAIEGARACKKHIGICGQAPSDYPELAKFLIKEGITSLSLNADAIIPFLLSIA
jgi:pyruvate,water dikinase